MHKCNCRQCTNVIDVGQKLLEYQFFWILFPIVSGVFAFSNNRDIMGWFFAGLFFGPFGLLVAFLPKIDGTAFAETPLKDVEFHVKRGSSVKYITDTLSLTKNELEQACLRLVSENKITEDDCIKVLGGVPFSGGKVHFTQTCCAVSEISRERVIGF